MDPEMLTAKGQVPYTTKAADRCVHVDFGRLPTAVTSSNSETHVALFRPCWKRKPFLICFPNLVAKNVHLVAMMRLVFGF